jgi:hypothetical protein
MTCRVAPSGAALFVPYFFYVEDIMNEVTTVTRQLVPEDQRIDCTSQLFGFTFPLFIEPTIFSITSRMAPSYQGGYWQFWQVGEDGFYMAPEADRLFLAQSMNGWEGRLSADALGICACLTAFSHLSFSKNEGLGRICAEHYHRLRPVIYEHEEVRAVWLRLTESAYVFRGLDGDQRLSVA